MDRVIDIQRYWTTVVKNIGEFKQIANAENPEFNDLTLYLNNCLAETFINDSSVYGVERWEKICDINPNTSDTLEDRKIRILTFLNLKLPYTWRMLEQSIETIVGDGNYTMSLEYYTITINAFIPSNSVYLDLVNLINIVVPVNMEVIIIRRT